MYTLYTVLAGVLLLPLLLKSRFPYLWQDLVFAVTLIYTARKMTQYGSKVPAHTMLDIFLEQVQKRPQKTFLVFGGVSYTYAEVDQQSNKVARVLQKQGALKPGDCVAVFLENEPAYVWIWLGLAKLGCSMACLNFHIRSKSFIHCFKSSGAKALIVAADLKCTLEDVLPTLREDNITIFCLGEKSQIDFMESLNDKMKQTSDQPLPASLRSNITLKSTAVYIFTSGTTGLPKAAIISYRHLYGAGCLLGASGTTSKDIVYCPLPLYHSAGFMIGLAGCINTGATFVSRRKFSASEFWNDCRKYNITVIQYIGEVLRYLCNVPKKDNDRDHKVKVAVGNGVRADVWKEFLNRFGYIKICEFYGATEGNVGFFNYTNKIGASGRVNFIQKKFVPYCLIKFDPEKEEAIRDANGHCIKVPTGETGLLVCKISENTPFMGYAGNKSLTEKKYLRDVFQKGDIFYNSGDLLMIDHDDFAYFQDRVGDTFRWKGENVSTTEVADIIEGVDFIQEVNIYGVTVPGHEGRIGMASIKLVDNKAFDGPKLYKYVVDNLPNYARPCFVRIQDVLEITTTFKQRKVKLVEEGFNPTTIRDPLYFLDENDKTYQPLSQQIYDSIIDKKIKL